MEMEMEMPRAKLFISIKIITIIATPNLISTLIYRNASPNASFKRDLDQYGYRVVGKIDRNIYDRSVILDRYDDRYVRIRTPENKIVTVINDTLQIIDILTR